MFDVSQLSAVVQIAEMIANIKNTNLNTVILGFVIVIQSRMFQGQPCDAAFTVTNCNFVTNVVENIKGIQPLVSYNLRIKIHIVVAT
jgi:hypothetical protein